MPRFSNGWLSNFQARKNIKNRLKFGESGDLDENATDLMVNIRQALAVYEPKNIFSCDETGLYWKMIPDRSLTTCTVAGRKKYKARISAHFCCNSDGSEKLPIWIIGQSKKPRAFGSINVINLGVIWRSNKKAWMTGSIFKEWLL
jgi:hypothetical protein